MENRKNVILSLIGFVVLLIIMSGSYTISETEQIIITRFGKPIGGPVNNPGIHFKIPFLEEKHSFDKRFLEWDGNANQIPTKDKRFVWIDTYARWRISDPLLFFQRVRDERGAQARLDDILDGETRNAIANHLLVEIVRSSNRDPEVQYDSLQLNDDENIFPTIKIGREKITREILANASNRIKEMGIELLDLRFKRINYVEEVQRKIYERMITERKRIADKYRSEGQGQASKILGDKERELKRIQSEAYRTAQEIIGKADAEATAIYAKAYNKSADSRDFYRFLKTLDTYRNTLGEKDWLILSTKSDYFKYLEKISGK
jgi:membrane protease subunit HflC